MYLNLIISLQFKQMRQATLEQYRVQRSYRQQQRKQYLEQFEILRNKLLPGSSIQKSAQALQEPKGHLQQPSPNAVVKQGQSKRVEQNVEQEQNKRLKQQLQQIEQEQRQKLNRFKEQMESAKNQYFAKIKQLKGIQLASKQQVDGKITKLEQQLKGALAKNKQIQNVNTEVESEFGKVEAVMGKYLSEMKEEYDSKLGEFDEVYKKSSDKIQAMQDQYNEQQFVDATLQNQQIVSQIISNIESSDPQIQKILIDYTELLKGKSQIQAQLQQNNKMKEQEITKMSALESKLKTICEKINEEKQIYLQENKKMAEELLEIKALLVKVMGDAGAPLS